jgi:hypothetical protein
MKEKCYYINVHIPGSSHPFPEVLASFDTLEEALAYIPTLKAAGHTKEMMEKLIKASERVLVHIAMYAPDRIYPKDEALTDMRATIAAARKP